MATHIPTYSICHLMDDSSTVGDCVVFDLETFISSQENMVISPHRHLFYQVLFITNGSGEHFIDFETHKITNGDIYFLAPGQVHKWDFTSQTTGFIINFTENFFSTFLARRDYLNDFPFFLGNGLHSKLSTSSIYNSVLEIFSKIAKEYKHCIDCSHDLIRAYLLELFILCNREVNSLSNSLFESKHQFYLLRNFEKLIEENYRGKRLPREYAEMLFVTPNHLNALCKKVKGQSAGEIIRNRVLLECKRLLINSDMSISEIAYHLNFQDNSYFSRFFKKYEGKTPEDFRRQKAVVEVNK